MAVKTPAEDPGADNPKIVETDPVTARREVLDDPELSSEDYMRASSDSEYLEELVEKRRVAGGEAQTGEGEGTGEEAKAKGESEGEEEEEGEGEEAAAGEDEGEGEGKTTKKRRRPPATNAAPRHYLEKTTR